MLQFPFYPIPSTNRNHIQTYTSGKCLISFSRINHRFIVEQKLRLIVNCEEIEKSSTEMSTSAKIEASVDGDKQLQQSRIQIYTNSNDEISKFWREKYEKDAKRNWDIFYKHHQDKFFKDRHYLEKEWGHHFAGQGNQIMLEIGCGAGNTVFPLLAAYPDLYIHACDFSPRAIDLVKKHKDFTEARVNAFVCDLTVDDLCKHIPPSSVDLVTLIFVLSAVSPEKMPLVLQNIRKILKPNAFILFRDYATGDLAQERFTGKEQKISENFYVRGDGTRAFYFSDDFLENLFKENDFSMKEHALFCKQVKNRSRNIIMNRRWVQAAFQPADCNLISEIETICENGFQMDDENCHEIDISEGIAVEMFGQPSNEEIMDVSVRDYRFKIKVISKEYQHTCTSTGLMLWESARLMAYILATNPEIVSGKSVLELGCGCSGLCSMIAATSADLVVATDGDIKALDFLNQNVASNLKSPAQDVLTVRKLEWGNATDIAAVKQLNMEGFDVIIGTDVTYIPGAINHLFDTARQLLTSSKTSEEKQEPVLILCHVLRRVDEPSITSAAYQHGFQLVDRWPRPSPDDLFRDGIIENWFPDYLYELPTTALSIMYFHFQISNSIGS